MLWQGAQGGNTVFLLQETAALGPVVGLLVTPGLAWPFSGWVVESMLRGGAPRLLSLLGSSASPQGPHSAVCPWTSSHCLVGLKA